MATKVHMEALSPTMEEGQLVRWLKNEGDAVKEGDGLAEVETDKATMELVARGSGVLRARMIGEGQTAPVGTVIGVIAGADEDITALTGGAAPEAKKAGGEKAEGEKAEGEKAEGESKKAEPKRPRQDSAAVAVAARGQTEQPHEASIEQAELARSGEPHVEPEPTGEGNGRGRVKASPLARRLAADAGVELSGISGSGPGGRIVRRDIEGAETRPSAAAEAAPRVQQAYAGPEVEEVAVSQMRKTIAKRLVTSIGPIPTFYLTIETDMTRMAEARERINERLKDAGIKTSINDFLIKAVAAALARHPEVNASWAESVIRRYHRVHVGVAVAVEDGLITPIVRDADRKGVAEISAEVRELAARAREKKLKPEEYTGATFSISNLGMFGIDEFTAIINPPESAILAVGQVTDTVVAVNRQPVVQPRMRMTMSCDHRVIDGATGARFLQTLRGFIEEPMMILV
ncbi:MAG: pyruvate dehydrogenase complex dihydrolipoamide acetyltransferase [Longimicrobiales bacterium]